MNLFLDTHVLLWWLDDNPSLSEKVRRAIANVENIVIVSTAVIWEMRIKQALGKLEIPSGLIDVIKRQGFEILPITADHAYAVGDLPAHHRDPFDRMIIAQAGMEGFTTITHDALFKKYGIPVLEV
ncbi:MAG: type II toxin-antitoxin system VapC family toxin [Proteobacteria bacterium]|nr:type II toxin-antitoxin system VapC family toxin [Pseudomonadota bacterium]